MILSKTDVENALARYVDDEISDLDLTGWANLLEMREDVGYEPQFELDIADFVFHAANPELERRITIERARTWLQCLH